MATDVEILARSPFGGYADPEVVATIAGSPWLDPPGWWDYASCASVDPEIFFPEKGGSTREAKKVCRGCPVRRDCLDDAIARDERFGVRGGLSERERRRPRKEVS